MRTYRTRRSVTKLPLGGLGLLIAGAVLVAVPFVWLTFGSHPLSGKDEVNVCAILDPETLSTLPYEVLAREQRTTRDLGSQCLLDLGFADLGDDQIVALDVIVLTQAQLRGDRAYVDTEKYWQSFTDEASASGADAEVAAGPWRHAALLHQGNGSSWFFAEDHGVVIWLRADEMPQEELIAFASVLVPRLREAPVDK